MIFLFLQTNAPNVSRFLCTCFSVFSNGIFSMVFFQWYSSMVLFHMPRQISLERGTVVTKPARKFSSHVAGCPPPRDFFLLLRRGFLLANLPLEKKCVSGFSVHAASDHSSVHHPQVAVHGALWFTYVRGGRGIFFFGSCKI